MGDHADIDHSGLTGVGDVAAHEADTTSVHGVANTANLYAAGGTDVAVADGGTGASTAAGARTNLGLVIGTDVPGQTAFDDHSARHENGGADEITVAGLSGTLADPQTPAAHAASHQNGGSDEIDVTGLTGAGGGGGGALVLLEQYTASASATLDFTTCISATYDEYVIEILRLIPATDSVSLLLRFSTDGGSTFIATGYQWAHQFIYGAGTYGGEGSSSATGVALSGNSVASAGVGVSGTAHLYDPANASSSPKAVTKHTTRGHTSVGMVNDMGSGMLSVGAVNAVRFLFDSGNIASGTIRVYGIAKT